MGEYLLAAFLIGSITTNCLNMGLIHYYNDKEPKDKAVCTKTVDPDSLKKCQVEQEKRN